MDAWLSWFKEEPWEDDGLTEGMAGFGDGKPLSSRGAQAYGHGILGDCCRRFKHQQPSNCTICAEDNSTERGQA